MRGKLCKKKKKVEKKNGKKERNAAGAAERKKNTSKRSTNGALSQQKEENASCAEGGEKVETKGRTRGSQRNKMVKERGGKERQAFTGEPRRKGRRDG